MKRAPYTLLLLLGLVACTAAPTAAPVAPVTGLPAGTDDYPWWNDSVFYEIFVRSFYDSNGDGVGDFKGITAKLDYLAELGVTGLWLMPVNPATSYHGYDVTDYYAVNPDYGAAGDFQELVGAARQRGMRVIVDLVLNHTSSRHPWFVAAQDPASPYHNWYVWSDTNPDAQVWHPAANGQFYYGFFGAGMPDLNYNNPAVTAQMQDVARFWLKDMGVDGFRLDAAQYLIEDGAVRANSDATHRWFKAFRTFYKSVSPQAVTVGEVWAGSYAVAPYLQGDELDLAFDFDLAKAFVGAARLGGVDEAVRTLPYDYREFKPLQFAAFLTNHDMDRGMSLFRDDPAKAKVAAALLLTAPGVPFLYYGEEIGMDGRKPDPQIRTPMQWTPDANAGFTTGQPWEAVNSDFITKNVQLESRDANSVLAYYRDLVRLRNQHAALRVGALYSVDTGNPDVYAILRATREESVLVVINAGKSTAAGCRLSLAAGPLSGAYHALPMLGTGKFPDLTATAQGGFDGYQLLPELAPQQSWAVQLQPVR